MGTLADPSHADVGDVGLLATRSIPFVLRVVSMVFVTLWVIALVYFVVKRW